MNPHPLRSVIQDNIIIFSLCSGILVLFVVLWIAPRLAERNSLSVELPRMQTLQKDIEQVKAINTVLDQKLVKLTALPLIAGEEVDIAADNAEAILADLKSLAADHGIVAVELIPELITKKNTATQRIRLTCDFTGPLNSCRQMLIDLSRRKHISGFEHITMLATDNETIALRLVMTVDIL